MSIWVLGWILLAGLIGFLLGIFSGTLLFWKEILYARSRGIGIKTEERAQ